MTGRICMITGANSGIGKVTALELAKQGMEIIMVCRDNKRGEEARKEIIAQSNNQKVHLYQCDLGIQADIVKLVQKIQQDFTSLDILINNAGLVLTERQTTQDGYEATFAINHLGPFLLTNLLLELLKKGKEPRIITVSSEAHRLARLNFNNLASPANYGAWVAYGNSKLANILFTKYLAELVSPFGITANCLHPGVVATRFGKGNSGWIGTFFSIFSPFLITAQKGAETTVYLATSPEVKQITGEYFNKKKPKTPSKEALSRYNAEKLWELSINLTNLEKHLSTVKMLSESN
ncbi:SDR family oxidoreductase [Rhodocytophaga rosea]|uniref:SDR family oxidoreductase n=1 Tax=Rhodocytophaga rosea TaxID=2704465 RepID=A0A6C0GIT2_9BACT|nr:SDR family oxidoreductase [Rhodocytophaga rosea]QHT67918.1 SDR family oxidoreductase [Rhodocytophaga rosea]